MKIGDLIMGVIADMKGFTTSVVKEATKTGDKAGAALGKSAKKSMGSELKGGLLQGLGIGAGLGIAGGAAMVAGAAADLVSGAIKASSDLRESMSLTDQVFEGNTEQMKEWAEGADKAFGQSQREALNFASNFGNAFKNVDFSLEETTRRAQEMTHLAADLGSAFNASSEEAATALRSGLLGESEPLRRFGVFLDEAKTKAKAVQMGIAKLGDVLTDNQKVTARYALILEQTADSQGMFGRDTESLADAQKAAQAEMENLAARAGDDLLPVMLEVTKATLGAAKAFGSITAAVDLLNPALERTTRENTELLDQIADGLEGLGPVLNWVGSVGRNLAHFGKETREAAEAADELARSERSLGAVVEDAPSATRKLLDLTRAAEDNGLAFKTWSARVIESSRDVRRRLTDDMDALIDNVYDPAILRDELSAQKAERAAARKILASKTASDAEKRDARSTLHQVEKDIEQTLQALAAAGQLSQGEISKHITALEKKYKTATGKSKAAIGSLITKWRELQALGNKPIKLTVLQQTAIAKRDPRHEIRDSGGPTKESTPYWIKTRQDELMVPGAGHILTRAQASEALGAAAGSGYTDQSVTNLNIGRMDRDTMPDVIRRLRRVDDVKRIRIIAG